jgi:hypothetical protein
MHPRFSQLVVASATTAVLLGLLAAPAKEATARSGAVVNFGLVFNGSHAPATFPSPNGLMHQGPFTTADSRCPSGYAQDTAIHASTESAVRLFTCDSGDTFVARVAPLPAEHGGSGTWKIISGTGNLVALRGMGTWTSTLVSGDPADPSTVTFRSEWQGIAADDATAPTVAVTHIAARRRSARRGSLNVRLRVSDETTPVRYALTVRDAGPAKRVILRRAGSVSSGTIAISQTVRISRSTRRLILAVRSTDAVGNQRLTTRRIALRRR